MDQKNIGQVSGINGQEYQDFSDLNSSSVEQVPNEVGQMTPESGFPTEQMSTGMTQEEAAKRLNQMFEAQGMANSNSLNMQQMMMGQMATQAQMGEMPVQNQMGEVPMQGQIGGVPMNGLTGEMPVQGQAEEMLTQTQPNEIPRQGETEQVPNFEMGSFGVEQGKNLETERAGNERGRADNGIERAEANNEFERGEEGDEEGATKSDLGKIVTVGTLTFEDGKLIGTDLPKARDRDGLEEEILKEVEEIKKIKSPTMQYRQEKMLSKKLLKDRYGRTPGQEN